MDKRKLQSKNLLHKKLNSFSQLAVKNVTTSAQNNIVERSVSDVDNRSLSRKRKNSEDEDKNSSLVSSMKIMKAKKKKRSLIIDSDNEDNVAEESLSMSSSLSKFDDQKTMHDKFLIQGKSQECNSNGKLSDDSEEDEENNQNKSTSGSYIKGILKALDKSPKKLSQTSNSSIDRYRKLNLRTGIRSTLQRTSSKAIVNKYKQKVDNHSKSKEPFNDLNIKKPGSKTTLNRSLLKKREDSNEFIDSDDSILQSEEEISSFDLDDSNIKKAVIEIKNKTSQSVLDWVSKDKSICNISLLKNDKNKNENIENNINDVNIQRQTTCNENNKFIDFLKAAGIILNLSDNLSIANDDPREIIQKMKKLLFSKSFEVDEIIQFWNSYIDNEENMKSTLLEIKIETDDGMEISSKTISLSRILLQVPELQVQIIESLCKKLIDAVITSDSSEDAPWAIQVLQQFRFLEVIIDPDNLVKQIRELLNSSPEWFQREVIVFIPDIIIDTHHYETAEMLTKIMQNNNNLTNITLYCITNFTLSKNYKEDLREEVLKLLKNDIDINSLPAITRFILDGCATEAIAIKSFNALRLVDMSTNNKKNTDECHTHQMFIINAIKINMQLFKEVLQGALTVIKTSTMEAVPLDIIILILLHQITAKKKMIEVTLFGHIKDGYYKPCVLNELYKGFDQVIKNFQSTALNLAISLLKVESSVHTEFGIEWLRNIFVSQSDTSYKQREILERLLNLMGNKDNIVKNALEVLCRMVSDETERQYFQHHAAFLRCFVEKIDNLQFDEVATLYHIIHALCTQSELISNILNDDLSIIMQKQLCSSKVLTKCKGVLGAVMAIKHLAGNNETSDQAFQLLKKTLSNLKSCIKSQALFCDQLGKVLIDNKNNIDDQFLSEITNYFEDNFVNNCLVESNPDKSLVPKFGLNDPSMAESYYINFGNVRSGTFVSAFFKLLRICNLRLSGSLESINAVLGCSILMPEDLNMPDSLTADYIIHCINWFREIIGGFVEQSETLLREQVLKRLSSLMSLQGEFATMISMCESTYQPPPCYFHYFPVPQFVKMEMKFGKKGKKKRKIKNEKETIEEDKVDSTINKSLLLPDWENWIMGSELTIKNPAYFRQMDVKIINLLDTNMNIQSSQVSSENITISQICFIMKELLSMFENQEFEDYIPDLIKLLPKVCNKLKIIVSDLRKSENVHEQEALWLIICFLIKIFGWKKFKFNAKYNTLLRDGLRTLAGMMNESSALLRSCKDLVAEAYKYFESLVDVATQISLAVALANMCNCLMVHSVSFVEISKERQAKMAFGFLCLEWNNEIPGPQYRVALKDLLKMWLDNEPDPLQTVSSILPTLPEEVLSFNGPKSHLSKLASINKINFHLLVKQLFVGLVKGVELSLKLAETDPERIKIWLLVAVSLEKMSIICKTIKNNVYLVLFVRYTTMLYQILLTSGMKILETNVKYQTEEVLNVIKLFQRAGRFLRDIFCTARKDKNVTLLKLIPIAKSKRERFIFRVKGMLTANNSIGAFWMGNLLNKDLDGEEITTESSEEMMIDTELTNENNSENDAESEIFNSDSDADIDDDE